MTKDNYILGISAHFHDSAATLLKNGAIVAAVSEERFTRRKADWRFPFSAIEYCTSLIPEDQSVGDVVFYENPLMKSNRIFTNAFKALPRGAPIWERSLASLDQMHHALPRHLWRLVNEDQNRVHFTTHHRSHAASAFYASPYERAAVLVVDGVGEWTTTSIWQGEGKTLTALREIKFPNSLGIFYSAFTQYCGFKVNSGEYKLMGLAPFGVPLFKQKIYDNLIDVKPDGSFALNHDYFSFSYDLSTISDRFCSLFGSKSLQPGEPLSAHYMNVAASCQAVTVDIMQKLARTALELSNTDTLCLAGGVALNCVSNGEMFRSIRNLKNIWIQPAAGDAGGSLGAALQLAVERDQLPVKSKTADLMQHAYLGPEFQRDDIIDALDLEGLVYDEFEADDDAFFETIVNALDAGQIIGHFNGRMEFGPRALGNRSILADVRPEDMLQRVNRKIKFREGWRPFAPMILENEAKNYFGQPNESPYMLLVTKLKEKHRKDLTIADMRAKGYTDIIDFRSFSPSVYPAITHYDFSARVQTVSKHSNPRIHELLLRFKSKTGTPMLLNTSFNVRGEPIVCTPSDAVNCFINTHLDMLVIGQFIVHKVKQSEQVKERVGKAVFDAD